MHPRLRIHRAPLTAAVASAAILVGASVFSGASSPAVSADRENSQARSASISVREPAPRKADIVVTQADVQTQRAAEAEARVKARVKAREYREHQQRAAEEEQAKERATQKQEQEQERQDHSHTSRSDERSSVSGSPRAYAQSRMNAEQFQCFDSLVQKESSWNVRAQNPSSGAYGLMQALPGEKMASAGADWETNGITQIKWGLGYIDDRYGTPCGAWSHSQANGWY